MIINDIVAFLNAQHIGIKGTNLFVGELPLDKQDCIAVMPAPSPEPDKSIPFFVQTVDVWTRFSKTGDGYQKMQDIFDLFHRRHHFTMGSSYVYLSYALGGIDDLDRDVESRKLFKASFGFIFRAA
jgi:hypothetical protein